MHLKVANYITFFILITFCFASCDSKRVFDEYKSLPDGNWSVEKPVVFNFTINDTLSKRNLFINLRNNNKYPFSNLFLITSMKFPSGEQIIDTLEYDMTDKKGHFLGKGFTEIKENKLFYKENIIFPTTGNYSVNIEQSMRKNGEVEGIKALDGITEVGFRIEKTN